MSLFPGASYFYLPSNMLSGTPALIECSSCHATKVDCALNHLLVIALVLFAALLTTFLIILFPILFLVNPVILVTRLGLEAVVVLEGGQGADFRLEADALEVLLKVLFTRN